MVERLVEWCANHKAIVIGITLVVIGWGVWSVAKTPLDAIPDLSENEVIVFSQYMGRSPQVVEDQLTFPLATALQGLPGVQAIRATSMFGMSFIYIIFKDNLDLYWARSRVLEKLATLNSIIPPGATVQLGPDGTGVGQVFWYTLEGKGYDLATLRTIQDWFVRTQLQSVDGVAEVASAGGYVRQYQINVRPYQLELYDLKIGDVSRAVMKANDEVGGRIVETNGRENFLRGQGYFTSLAQFRDLVVATRNGQPIRLGSIADVEFGPEQRRGSLDKDGTGEAVGGIVVMRYGENAEDVINRVKARIAEIEPGLPAGVRIVPAYDRSELIQASVHNLEHTLIEESIIVTLVVLIFLFHFPSALRIVIEIPISVLIAFILMKMFGITSNIMSLGGIAIAIGVLVDAAIVLLENSHRHLAEAQHQFEEHGTAYDPRKIAIRSAQQVASPIFFSILIIVVSFLPVFLLTGEEGKLFHPLAYTKTFSLLASAVASVTLMPVLMTLGLRVKRIRSEEQNPVSMFFRRLYMPVLRSALRFRKSALLLMALLLAVAVPVAMNIGSEFMPPLDEGSLLFMPMLVPSVSMDEAARIMQVQDAIIKRYPEVEQVLGKVGKAETATDPAPQNMIETIIQLKPRAQWRAGITKDSIIDDLNRELAIPGVANGWTQPIINRINMLTTGVRTDLGLKFFGSDLDTLERLAIQAEGILKQVPGSADVAAERVEGGSFLAITPKPDAGRRYGISTEQINDIIQEAIGGMKVGTDVQGRAQYPVVVRYGEGYWRSLEDLRQMPVPVAVPQFAAGSASAGSAPAGASASAMSPMSGTEAEAASGQASGTLRRSTDLLAPDPISTVQYIPLGELANILMADGPPMISSENAMLRSIVYLDVRGRDMGSFVDQARTVLAEKLHLPAGYTLAWSGQYENEQHAAQSLKIMLPLVFIIIFLLLLVTLHDPWEAGIVMLSVPFALVGGVFLIALLGMNWSVAVWVGFIALYGIATETGVVMVVYLHEALDHQFAAHTDRALTREDIYAATIAGAALRLRPKLMTVAVAMFGLIPILFSNGTGSDVMKPIAAPMIGGMLSSAICVLIIVPVLFYLVKVRALRRGTLRPSAMSKWMQH